MLKLILALCVFVAGFVPASADAELLCQQRKSKRIVLAEECAKGFHPIFDLGPITALNGQIDALKATLNEDLEALKATLDEDLEALGTDLNDRTDFVTEQITELESVIEDVLDVAIAPVTASGIAADAVDGTKVKNNSIELDDLAPSLMLPFPSTPAGNHGRVVSAELDMNTADGDDVGVEDEDGRSWLQLLSSDAASATAVFVIDPDVFDGPPRCIAGMTDSGAADLVRGLGLQVGEDEAGSFLRLRVTGQNRQLDVTGTVICTGRAKL